MEDNNPTVDQSANFPENNQITPPHPKTNPLVVVSLILLILLLSAGSFILGKYITENKTEPVDETVPIAKKPVALPTTNPTANWKTYTNTAYKFSIKYPPDWTIEVKPGEDANTSSQPYLSSPCDYEAGDRCGQIGIDVENYYSSKKLEDYFRLNSTGPKLNRVINKITTKLDEENAIDIEWFNNNYYSSKQNDQGAVFKTIKAVHIDKVYSLLINEAGKSKSAILTSKDWKNKYLYDQILSTFRFLENSEITTPVTLDQEPEPTTSPQIVLKYNLPEGWKTTEKIENLYTVSYDPGNWLQSCYKGCSILLTKNQIYHFQTYILPYDGGSRRALLQKQFTGPFEEFVEIEIDGKRGLMAPLKWNANFDNEIIFGFPRGDKMIIIKTNLLIVYGEKSSGFDRDYLYKFLGTLKID